MGLRFRRSVRLLPGVRVNLSKSGASLSLGRRGAWFTIGPRGTRATVGLPGTGISYTTNLPLHQAGHRPESAQAPEELPEGNAARGWLWIVLVIAVVAVAVKACL